MSNFTTDESMVRVDFWKESGKWYDTVALKWDRYSAKSELNGSIETVHETFKRCLKEQFGQSYIDMRATCIEPYHENSHPVSLIHK